MFVVRTDVWFVVQKSGLACGPTLSVRLVVLFLMLHVVFVSFFVRIYSYLCCSLSCLPCCSTNLRVVLLDGRLFV